MSEHDPSLQAGNQTHQEALFLNGHAYMADLDTVTHEGHTVAEAVQAGGLDGQFIEGAQVVALGGDKRRGVTEVDPNHPKKQYFVAVMTKNGTKAQLTEVSDDLIADKADHVFRIGRGVDSDLVLADRSVSQVNQAVIARSPQTPGYLAVGSEGTFPTFLIEVDRPKSEVIDNTVPKGVGGIAVGQSAKSVMTTNSENAPSAEVGEYDFKGIDIFDGVEADPQFTSIAEPFHKELQAIKEQEQAELASIKPDDYGGMHDAVKKWKELRSVTRNRFENAVKPYLHARLELYRDDKEAGYSREGRLSYDPQRMQVRTARDQRVSHYDGKKFVSSDIIRLGQVTLPDRFNSWAGSDGGKKNHKTGKRTTSTKHIVDLAAAMAAGTFTSAHEPIVIKRDSGAEKFQLPEQVANKGVRMYAVELGMHRIAAQRLLYGIDSTVSYDEITGV